MNIKCTKCGSFEVYVVQDKPAEKTHLVPTMDEFAKKMNEPVPLVYKMTTLACRKCGYEISY